MVKKRQLDGPKGDALTLLTRSTQSPSDLQMRGRASLAPTPSLRQNTFTPRPLANVPCRLRPPWAGESALDFVPQTAVFEPRQIPHIAQLSVTHYPKVMNW